MDMMERRGFDLWRQCGEEPRRSLAGRVTGVLLSLGLAAASPSHADVGKAGFVGDYLKARTAIRGYDYGTAFEVTERLLREDPGNDALRRQLFFAKLLAGRFDGLSELAESLRRAGHSESVYDDLLVAADARAGRFDSAAARLEEESAWAEHFRNQVLRGWIAAGRGVAGGGAAAFAGSDRVDAFHEFHAGLAAAMFGDFETARDLMSGIPTAAEGGRPSISDQVTMARAQILVQLGEREEALAVLDAYMPALSGHWTHALSRLRDRIADGESIDFDLVSNAVEGIAEFYAEIARGHKNADAMETALIFARISQMLDPDDTLNAIEVALCLTELESYALALEQYSRIGEDDPLHYIAGIGRVRSLGRLGRHEEAAEEIDRLIRRYPDNFSVRETLGQLNRFRGRYAEAALAYDEAIRLLEDRLEGLGETEREAELRGHWTVYYFRGIAHERRGDWESARADLRLATDYSGGNPFALNYLGYSMVEKREDLDVAEKLLRDAIRKAPDIAAIVDSLGWVLYRLGRYDESRLHMERAVKLEPSNPVIVDHLGDVYWKLGLFREAEFQWRRALFYDDEESDEDRISRKLAVGLDAVLAAEDGDDPLE